VAVLAAGLALFPGPARGAAQGGAQDPFELLRIECAGGANPDLVDRCGDAAVALEALRGGVSLLAAGGSDVPGTASTIGLRLGTVPRVSVALRLSAARLRTPEVLSGTASPGTDAFFATALQVNATVGLLRGFSLDATLGGDLLLLPGGPGFQDQKSALAFGARLGLLRESFTLPGISLSVMQRNGGTVRFGDLTQGDAAQLEWDLSTTSVRATVGKDLLALGLMGGVGWDWSRGDVRMTLSNTGPGSDATASGDFRTRRTVYFGGASLTFLIAQISLEGGWATGFTGLPAQQADFDPGKAVPFGSLALRLTF